MPIAYILGNLLGEVGDAAGVVFLDEVGEAIETASSQLSLDEMRTTGAIAEVQFRRLREVVAPDRLSGGILHIEGEGTNLSVSFLSSKIFEDPHTFSGITLHYSELRLQR